MEQLEEKELGKGGKKDLDYTIQDGAVYSVGLGISDNYVPAAAILNGASNFDVGLLAAVPSLAGSLLQFFSSSLIRKVGCRKTVVIAGVIAHLASWLAIIAIMFYPGVVPFWVMLAAFSIGIGANTMVNPAWSSWIADLVPENERGQFFAKRNRYMNLLYFITIFAAGIALSWLDASFGVRVAFALVFFVAFAARLYSLYCLSKTFEPAFTPTLMHEVQLKHLFLLPAYKNQLAFIFFASLIAFANEFASPFYMPYMINTLHLDLATIGTISAITVITKIIALPYWGKMVERFGNRAVLSVCAIGISLNPLLWLLSKNPLHLMLFNVFSGFVWSGFDLATFNYLLASVSRELRTSFVAKFNLFNGFLYAAGALAGGVFVSVVGAGAFLGLGVFSMVFLISGLMRLFVTFVFVPLLPKKDIEVESGESHLAFKVLAVYPAQGFTTAVAQGFNSTNRALAAGAVKSRRLIHEIVDYGIPQIAFDIGTKEGRKLVDEISRLAGKRKGV